MAEWSCSFIVRCSNVVIRKCVMGGVGVGDGGGDGDGGEGKAWLSCVVLQMQ